MKARYLSHARIKSGSSPQRLAALAEELEGCGCRVQVRYNTGHLDFEVTDREERWIVIGGLRALLQRYEDVVSWSPNFETCFK